MTVQTPEFEISRSLFVSLLRQELDLRLQRNPRYSRRAFAKALGIDQSFLSKVLAGQRLPSIDLIAKAKTRLRLDLVQATKKNSKLDLQYQSIEDSFHLMAEWGHFALLELLRTEDFIADEKWICARLGMSRQELDLIVSRLRRLGYMEIKKKQWLLRAPSLTWANGANTTEARKLLQKEVMLMSQQAIDKVDFELRDHSSLTVALDPKLIPELKQRITLFRRSLDQFITQQPHPPKEVYQFTFSFFPVTRKVGEDR
jgi:uncharacterized protein (TIGR02147 family)